MKYILQNVTKDLQLASYSPRTVEAYSYHVKKFLEYFSKNPESITENEIKDYFLYLKYTKKLSGSASAQAISGIKFMFEKTLDMKFNVFGIVKNPRGKKLPVILTLEEVRDVLKHIRILRHRACLTLIYTCGLRLHEATNISPLDIDSQREEAGIKKKILQFPCPIPVFRLFLKKLCGKAVLLKISPFITCGTLTPHIYWKRVLI